MITNGIISLVVILREAEGSLKGAKYMSKDTKTLLWIIGIIVLLTNPGLLFLGVIIYIVYLNSKGKNKFESEIKKNYTKKDKTYEHDVIDTTAEVIDSKVIKDEWKATKEYRH